MNILSTTLVSFHNRENVILGPDKVEITFFFFPKKTFSYCLKTSQVVIMEAEVSAWEAVRPSGLMLVPRSLADVGWRPNLATYWLCDTEHALTFPPV